MFINSLYICVHLNLYRSTLKITKPQKNIYQWSKADWRSIREQTVVFAENFLASASTRNINENYNTFKEYLEETMSSKIPTKFLKS